MTLAPRAAHRIIVESGAAGLSSCFVFLRVPIIGSIKLASIREMSVDGFAFRRLLAAPKRVGGTDFRSANFSLSVFSFSFINAAFYHAFTAFLSQEGQEGEEGQDIFKKDEKHWEIEGFLHAQTNEPAKPHGPMARGLEPEPKLFAVYFKN